MAHHMVLITVLIFFPSGLLIKGHLFSSEATITNTCAGCFLVACIHFLHSGSSTKVKVSGYCLQRLYLLEATEEGETEYFLTTLIPFVRLPFVDSPLTYPTTYSLTHLLKALFLMQTYQGLSLNT